MNQLNAFLENLKVGSSGFLTARSLLMSDTEFAHWSENIVSQGRGHTSTGLTFDSEGAHEDADAGKRHWDVVKITRTA